MKDLNEILPGLESIVESMKNRVELWDKKADEKSTLPKDPRK